MTDYEESFTLDANGFDESDSLDKDDLTLLGINDPKELWNLAQAMPRSSVVLSLKKANEITDKIISQYSLRDLGKLFEEIGVDFFREVEMSIFMMCDEIPKKKLMAAIEKVRKLK